MHLTKAGSSNADEPRPKRVVNVLSLYVDCFIFSSPTQLRVAKKAPRTKEQKRCVCSPTPGTWVEHLYKDTYKSIRSDDRFLIISNNFLMGLPFPLLNLANVSWCNGIWKCYCNHNKNNRWVRAPVCTEKHSQNACAIIMPPLFSPLLWRHALVMRIERWLRPSI